MFFSCLGYYFAFSPPLLYDNFFLLLFSSLGLNLSLYWPVIVIVIVFCFATWFLEDIMLQSNLLKMCQWALAQLTCPPLASAQRRVRLWVQDHLSACVTYTHTHKICWMNERCSVLYSYLCIKAFGIVICYSKNQFYFMVILFEIVIKDEPTALG